jgi:hypothetical protein
MRNILIATALFLSTPAMLSAQVLASFDDVQRTELEISNSFRFFEQNILLALCAGVCLLGILWFFYVLKATSHSNRPQQNTSSHFMMILLLIIGIGSASISKTPKTCSSESQTYHWEDSNSK